MFPSKRARCEVTVQMVLHLQAQAKKRYWIVFSRKFNQKDCNVYFLFFLVKVLRWPELTAKVGGGYELFQVFRMYIYIYNQKIYLHPALLNSCSFLE